MTKHSARRLVELYLRGKDRPEEERTALVREAREESPELADDLQDLFDEEEVGSIPERLQKQYGTSVDPQISLEGESGADSGFTEQLVGRLAHHAEGFERYRLKGELARGGQGAILRVWDEDLRRNLAMKVILGDGSEDLGTTVRRTNSPTPKEPTREQSATRNVDPLTLGRFLEEAQITSQLDHPGIVPVHELGLDAQGHVYFTMKLVKGSDLRQVFNAVQQQKEEWTQTGAVNILLKTCEAVAYAHAKGVIHRDLKPGNVMVGKYGEVYVMDWGLARVMGRPDDHDLRFQPSMKTDRALSPRHSDSTPDSPLITMDGTVIGTPAYMSPEQAMGQLEEMGPPSDVYALGAMLYHLMAGHPPYVEPGMLITNHAIWCLVQNGPPKPLANAAPDSPAELVAICERAMARKAEQRYADTAELAEDLKAYLEHRVVAAYETGAVAELRKWVLRNRTLAATIAATILAIISGLGGVSYVEAKGKEVERIKNDDILRLSAAQDLEDLVAEADTLWPPYPENLESYERWLAEADALVAGLPGHRERLERIRSRADQRTSAQRKADRASHPQHAQLQQLERLITSRQTALDIRQGKVGPPELRLDEDDLPEDSTRLNELAERKVHGGRLVHGEEALGLAVARLAVERAASEEQVLQATRTLAGAFLVLGQGEKGLAALQELERDYEGLLTNLQQANLRKWQREIESNLANWSEEAALAELEELNELREQLEASIAKRRVWHFSDGDDAWWHSQLLHLIDEIEAFRHPDRGLIEGTSPEHGWGVALRRDFAATLAERSVEGPVARAAWEAAIASIADRERFGAYDGLELAPQIGLLPIGPDPETGLWEFAHLPTGAPAARGDDGLLTITEETGVVLVLIPGGDFQMGVQWTNPAGANYDLQGNPSRAREAIHLVEEVPVHRLTMSPFFLSKYELSQAQWLRLEGRNPSAYPPEHELVSSLLHPVESVSWHEAREACVRTGLALPTEAQWEFAARAGTNTVWWSGDSVEELQFVANLKDPSIEGGQVAVATAHDGYGAHAPVDAYAANAFGLHGVIGNVMEWCQDGFDPIFYGRCGLVDPVAGPALRHVVRGGGFESLPVNARSGFRNRTAPETAGDNLGLRPARALEP